MYVLIFGLKKSVDSSEKVDATTWSLLGERRRRGLQDKGREEGEAEALKERIFVGWLGRA